MQRAIDASRMIIPTWFLKKKSFLSGDLMDPQGSVVLSPADTPAPDQNYSYYMNFDEFEEDELIYDPEMYKSSTRPYQEAFEIIDRRQLDQVCLSRCSNSEPRRHTPPFPRSPPHYQPSPPPRDGRVSVGRTPPHDGRPEPPQAWRRAQRLDD